MKRLASTPLLALCLLLSTPVQAEQAPPAPPAESSTEAAALKAQGDDAMQRLDYATALSLYEQAYAHEKNPALLYNRGRALQALRRFPEALDALEAFEREAPSELKARVPKLAELLSEVRGKVSTLALTANVKGARILVAQRVIGTTPLSSPVRLNAGAVVVEVTADGYHPYKKRVELPPAGRLELAVELRSKSTTGILEVGSPVPGAAVWVGGHHIGTVPAQTVLDAGTHQVTVRKEGYEPASTTAVVRVGATNHLDVPLEKPPGITSRWWFWTGVGAVVLGGTALTIALLTERDPEAGSIPPGQVSGPLVRF